MIHREPEEEKESQETPKEETPPVESDNSWLTMAGNQAGEGIKKTTRKALDQVLGWFQEKIE